MMAPAAVSWAAWLGILPLNDTPLAFLASPIAVGVLTVLAIGELISDQLPKTPSRKVPPQFIARIVTGGLAGADGLHVECFFRQLLARHRQALMFPQCG